MQGFHFRFSVQDARQLFYWLLLIECFFVAAYLSNCWFSWPPTIFALFNLDADISVPAWFSSFQFGLTGVLFLLHGYSVSSNENKEPGVYWIFIFIGLGFVFLSMDEGAEFHEKITQALAYREWVPAFKGNHGVWIPVYLIVGLVMTIILRKHLLYLLKKHPYEIRMILAGMGIIFLGAVVMEIVSYQYLRTKEQTVWYLLEVALEEFFEMAGASLIFYAAILLVLQKETD